MKIVGCPCKRCQAGLRTRPTSKAVTKKVRSARRKAKQDLKQDKEPETRVLIGYTD